MIHKIIWSHFSLPASCTSSLSWFTRRKSWSYITQFEKTKPFGSLWKFFVRIHDIIDDSLACKKVDLEHSWSFSCTEYLICHSSFLLPNVFDWLVNVNKLFVVELIKFTPHISVRMKLWRCIFQRNQHYFGKDKQETVLKSV